jgi:hypothetical protein
LVRQDEQGNRYFYAELLPQTALSKEVAYRDVYLLNNNPSGKAVTVAVHYQDLEGTWRTTDWFRIGSGQQQKVCRTRTSMIYTAVRASFRPPPGAEILEIQTGLFKSKFYGKALLDSEPFPPVRIDVIWLWNSETEEEEEEEEY